jgi:hypothetical protein
MFPRLFRLSRILLAGARDATGFDHADYFMR